VLTVNILALATIPLATAVERRRFERVQRSVAMETLALASEARKAQIQAVAADEAVRYARQVRRAAEASAELARRMAQVGNWNKLQHAREQSFYADAALNLANAERIAASMRERFIRVLGLWGDQTQFQLPARLPDLPKEASDLPELEQRAIAERLDVQAARLNTEALARNLGLTKATRFINVLELGPARVLEGQRGDPYKNGYEISFQLPLFDWGEAKLAMAEAIYVQALHNAARVAVNARSEVRESYLAYRSRYDIARHSRDEIVPLRKRIAEENLLRYNGMLIGVFELLADAREQINSVSNYIGALRDFWLAQADLDMAMIGKPNFTEMPSAGTTRASVGAGASH
jgi:outer membrane protein TolC